MHTEVLDRAYRDLLDAAATVAAHGDPVAPAGEWDADRILAHVALVSAATVAAVAAVTAGANTTYDNRLAQDTWTLQRLVTLGGGNAGLRERIRAHGVALSALSGPALSDRERDTMVPALLLSHEQVLLDQPVPLRDLLTGLAEAELPGHTRQLLALLPA